MPTISATELPMTDTTTTRIPVADVRYVQELYPRLRPSDDVIDRYRVALDRLPPIVVARGGVLVDGYHRWKAHEREKATEIDAIDLGDLTDHEIIVESVRRNATHGQQLSAADKQKMAQRLWFTFAATDNRLQVIADLFAVSTKAIERWTKDIRVAELRGKQERAYDLWLNCRTQDAIAEDAGVEQKTISNWLSNFRQSSEFTKAPESRQHFDVWEFPTDGDDDSSYFGRLPVGVAENLLWLHTEPDDIVVDLFAGSGTVIKVGKRMGRRVWASDRVSAAHYNYLPIHTHDVADGWPAGAPKADLILLDPPYWRQAENRYSTDPTDWANVDYPTFLQSWVKLIGECAQHITDKGRIAYIIGPTQTDDGVKDHATDMLRGCWDAGLSVDRRVIVKYSTQQATGQQVTWARDGRQLLKLYRDLVVLKR